MRRFLPLIAVVPVARAAASLGANNGKKRKEKRAKSFNVAPIPAASTASTARSDIDALLSSLKQRAAAAGSASHDTSHAPGTAPLASSSSSSTSRPLMVHPSRTRFASSSQSHKAQSTPRAPGRRKDKRSTELPGGDLLDAVVPSPLLLMQSHRVSADVEQFLAKTKAIQIHGDDASNNNNSTHATSHAIGSQREGGPVMHVYPVPHTNLKRAVLCFTPASDCPPVLAIGQARKEKIARKLCLLHAASLIDHYSVHMPATSAVTSQPPPPPPPPLISDPSEADGVAAGGASHPASTSRSSRGGGAAAVPQPKQYTDWAAYVQAASAYAARHAEAERLDLLVRGALPRSGNPFVDRASARMAQRTKSLPKLLVQRLNNEIHHASREMHVVPIGREHFVASLPLEPTSKLVAIGVGRSSKVAKQRCAGHALYILQELQKVNASASGTGGGGGGQGREDDAGKSGAHSAPLPSLVESLKPRQSRLFAFFQRLCLDGPTTAAAASAAANPTKTPIPFQSRFTKNKADQFVCTVQLGDVTCEGAGINRFEAERVAVTSALTELELYDPRVRALGRFISRYPRADVHALVDVSLPDALRTQMELKLPQYEAALRESPPQSRSSEKQRGISAPDADEEDEAGASVHVFQTEEEGNETGVVASGGGSGGGESASASQTCASVAPRNLPYAAHLREQLCRLRANPTYLRQFHPRRSTLAMSAVRDELLTVLAHHRVVIVCGTTGCGKTTQVPQYILDDAIMRGCGDQCRILVTQPRRLTTFGVSDRIAKERLEEVGQTVGYAVRLDAKPGRHITLCTSGVLLQMLASSPNLEHCSHLILDEVHERDINCDVTLALVKTLLETNSNLKVILMSATMQHELFVNYFRDLPRQQQLPQREEEGDGAVSMVSGDVPVIHVEGQVYPVKELFLEDIAAACKGSPSSSRSATTATLAPFSSRLFTQVSSSSQGATQQEQQQQRRLSRRRLRTPPAMDYDLIAHLVHNSVQRDMGGDARGKSILVFLPGWKELMAAKRAIEDYPARCAGASAVIRPHIILLHSSIDSAQQKECFQPAPPGLVKVVLATNVAESGVTIDDVAVVIDTGLLKLTTWTAVRGGGQGSSSGEDGFSVPSSASSSSFGTQLSLGYASKANCTQRKGRAGRTQGGVCYRLFSRDTYAAMDTFQTAEIHRVSLAQVLLKLLSLGHLNPRETLKAFLEAPSADNVEASMAVLKGLGAVDAAESLTALGRYLSRLPCDPRVGKMIVMGAVLRCLDSVLTVAAASDASPFVNSRLVAAEVRQQRFLFARGGQSDHVSALNAYNAYCREEARAGPGSDAAFNFATAHFLHVSNLRLISRYKQQYYEILSQAGLLASASVGAMHDDGGDDTDSGGCGAYADRTQRWRHHSELFVDDGPLSANASDVAIVKACVCGSLFPNVAVLNKTPGSKPQAGKLTLRTKAHPSITPSKDSVCRQAGAPREHAVLSKEERIQGLLPAVPTPSTASENGTDPLLVSPMPSSAPALFYVYENIFSVQESRKDFLTNVSAVSLWALLLFGAGEANVNYDAAVGICAIDDWIFLAMSPHDFAVLQQLKQLLFTAVWRLYERPHDRDGMHALKGLRGLSYALLKAPVNGVDSTQDRQADLAPTSGCILPPLAGVTESAAGSVDDVAQSGRVVKSVTGADDEEDEDDDDDEDDDVFGIFIDEDEES